MSGKKITKVEIVDGLYEKTGMDRKDIKRTVDLFFEAIKSALTEGTAIEFRGFGTFEVRIRRGREKARNPKTGEPVAVGSHGTVFFRAGRELKQAVWDLPEDPGPAAGISDISGAPVIDAVPAETPAPVYTALPEGGA